MNTKKFPDFPFQTENYRFVKPFSSAAVYFVDVVFAIFSSLVVWQSFRQNGIRRRETQQQNLQHSSVYITLLSLFQHRHFSANVRKRSDRKREKIVVVRRRKLRGESQEKQVNADMLNTVVVCRFPWLGRRQCRQTAMAVTMPSHILVISASALNPSELRWIQRLRIM